MNCPICNNDELNEGAESCPKCGSDLEVFSHIEGAQKQNAFQKKSVIILAALLGIVVVSWGSVSLFSGNKSEVKENTVVADSAKTIAAKPDSLSLAITAITESLKKENEDLKAEVASMKSAKKTVKGSAIATKTQTLKNKKSVKKSSAPVEGEIITYTVKRGDSPWTISKKFFKNGSHAKQIVADNNLSNIKTIPVGTKLKIQK